MPIFKKKFPPKSIWVKDSKNNPIEYTFFSFEEAEWKLYNIVPSYDFFDALGMILMSDPSSMEYPFPLLSQEKTISPPIVSEDKKVRFIGVPNDDYFHSPPSMIAQYRVNGDVRLAGTEWAEARYYSLYPLFVDGFKKDNSTVYYLWGDDCYSDSWMGFRRLAYELDDNGLCPAFIYEGEKAESRIKADYFSFEKQVSEAIHHNALTKEQCCHFLCLSDVMFEFTRYANILARAAVRHHLGLFWCEEHAEEKYILNLQCLIDELLDATEKFGRNEDWDEYLRNVPGILCHYYKDKGDTENLKKYAEIAKRFK